MLIYDDSSDFFRPKTEVEAEKKRMIVKFVLALLSLTFIILTVVFSFSSDIILVIIFTFLAIMCLCAVKYLNILEAGPLP